MPKSEAMQVIGDIGSRFFYDLSNNEHTPEDIQHATEYINSKTKETQDLRLHPEKDELGLFPLVIEHEMKVLQSASEQRGAIERENWKKYYDKGEAVPKKTLDDKQIAALEELEAATNDLLHERNQIAKKPNLLGMDENVINSNVTYLSKIREEIQLNLVEGRLDKMFSGKKMTEADLKYLNDFFQARDEAVKYHLDKTQEQISDYNHPLESDMNKEYGMITNVLRKVTKDKTGKAIDPLLSHEEINHQSLPRIQIPVEQKKHYNELMETIFSLQQSRQNLASHYLDNIQEQMNSNILLSLVHQQIQQAMPIRENHSEMADSQHPVQGHTPRSSRGLSGWLQKMARRSPSTPSPLSNQRRKRFLFRNRNQPNQEKDER